jgi:protein-tyrosine phosphatase
VAHTATTRWLPLTTALNLRDVGGLPTPAGAHVRPGVLLRSGSLRLLDADDARALVVDYGVHTVVDLRTPQELAADGPTRLAGLGAATVHLPLITDIDRSMHSLEGAAAPALATAYQSILHEGRRHLVTAARLLAWTASGALLVHCALGKDRTGIVIAVLLDAVGVDRAAILDDYALTNDVVDTVLPHVTDSRSLPNQATAIPLAARVAEPAALAALLDHLDRDHGGAAAWLHAAGVEQFELDLLRQRLIDPSS